ncbi:MAG: c-type cytochrome [Actinomycetota bacterium]
MKILTSTIAIVAIAFSSVPSLAGDPMIVHGQKFADRNCVWCHGPSLQGFLTAPRLAGQSAEYVVNQLYNFRTHARDNPLSRQYMWGAAANHLGLQTAHALALYLSTLSPKAADDGDEALATRGRMIYQEGIPDANIPSCIACHGPNAEGAAAEGAWQIPRLGGLSYYYLKRRLEQWGEGYHAAAFAPMPEIAGKLSDGEIEALASYLSFVR